MNSEASQDPDQDPGICAVSHLSQTTLTMEQFFEGNCTCKCQAWGRDYLPKTALALIHTVSFAFV